MQLMVSSNYGYDSTLLFLKLFLFLTIYIHSFSKININKY